MDWGPQDEEQSWAGPDKIIQGQLTGTAPWKAWAEFQPQPKGFGGSESTWGMQWILHSAPSQSPWQRAGEPCLLLYLLFRCNKVAGENRDLREGAGQLVLSREPRDQANPNTRGFILVKQNTIWLCWGFLSAVAVKNIYISWSRSKRNMRWKDLQFKIL